MKRLLACAMLSVIPVASQAQVNWFTPEVRAQLGQEVPPGTPATPPPRPAKEFWVNNCRVVSYTAAYFDTVATYAQGRVVDQRTSKPIAGARVEITYRSLGRGCCEYQTVTTDAKGFFHAGWVGTSGPAGGRDNRILQVHAPGYPLLKTQQVSFGGLSYLHVELAAH